MGDFGVPLFKLLVSGEHAGTSFTDVDGCHVRPEAETARTQALPVRADARAVVPVQSRLRGLREDSVPGAHS